MEFCISCAVDVTVVADGFPVIGSREFGLRCNADQSPWRATVISHEWSTDRIGPLVSTLERNISILNTSFDAVFQQFVFNSSIRFNPLRVDDLGVYTCSLNLNLTYPDGPNNSSALISNQTTYVLSADGT